MALHSHPDLVVSLHRSCPVQVVADRTEEERPETAVGVDSRAAGMKSCRSCPATCQPVRRGRRLRLVGVSVGDVVFDPSA